MKIDQETVLTSLLRTLVVLGSIAYIPSLIACLKDGLYLLAVIDTLAYAAIAVAVFYPRGSYRFRLVVTVATSLFIGAAVLLTTGTEGAGHIWLIFGVVISALFGEIRIIIVSIVLAELIMLGYGFLIYFEVISSSMTMVSVVAISANMLLIIITLSLITHLLLKALNEKLDHKEELLQLLHHRVKNNLQTVESLIALEDDGVDHIDRISRRVAAVSAANELILSDPENRLIDLADLLGSFLRPGTDRLLMIYNNFISAEKLTETAVGLSDIFTILQQYGPLSVEITVSPEEKEKRTVLITVYPHTPFENGEALERRLGDTLFPA